MWNLEKKVQVNLFAKKKQRNRCREQTYGHRVNWELVADMYTLLMLCMK